MCVQRFDDSQVFCDSHYISRFATFFIDARAKRSFVESFNFRLIQTQTDHLHKYDATRASKHGLLPRFFEGRRPRRAIH